MSPSTFSGACRGLTNLPYLQADLEELAISDAASDTSDVDSEDDDLDPITAERKRRARRQDRLRRTAGEPTKPNIQEITKLRDSFGSMLRIVLAE